MLSKSSFLPVKSYSPSHHIVLSAAATSPAFFISAALFSILSVVPASFLFYRLGSCFKPFSCVAVNV